MAPSQSRFLLFVKSGGNYRALRVKSGQVLNMAVFENPDLIRRLDITDDTDAIKEVLQSMTIQSIVDTLEGLGFAGIPAKPKKDPLVRSFLDYWDEIKGNVERIGGSVEALTPQPASSSGEAPSNVNVFSGTAHRIGDGEGYASAVQSAEIKLKVLVMDFRHKKDGYDFGNFEIKADITKSVHTLIADIAEYLEKTIFRSGSSWKQVLMFKGQYLTNLTLALNFLGINEDNNGLVLEVYAEDDPRFMEIMTVNAPAVEPKVSSDDVPQWTSDDERNLQFHRKINQGAIKINIDHLWALEAKKKAWEESKAKTPASASDACDDEQPVSESDDDAEWAECSPQDLENEIEEEDVLNPSETFPSDAKVKIIRVLKNKKDRRGFCLRMDVMKSDVEDILAKLEDKDVIGDADDFVVCFNGQRVKHDSLLRSFFDDTKGYITFTLRVRKLKGGGVHQSLKKKKEEREKRFRLLRSKMTEATQSVGEASEGIDKDLFKKCEKIVADLQSKATPATLAEMVSNFDTDTIKAFYEATDDGDLLFQEREVSKIAHCFIPVLNEVNACAEKCDALKTSLTETFTYIYALACVSESNRYTHSMVYDLVESRQKEIEEKAKKEDEIEAEVQRRMARLNVSADVEMK